MSRRTRLVALCGVFTALAVVMLYISAVFPTGQVGFVAAASLFILASLLEFGTFAAIGTFVAASVLSFLLVPVKSSVYVFVLFFGYYPIVKRYSELLRSMVLSWGIKLVSFNAALTVIYFLLKIITVRLPFGFNSTAVIIAVLNVVFVLFDIGLSGVMRFYLRRISGYLKK